MTILKNNKKIALQKEFELLKTLEQRLTFWSTRLPVNYIAYWEIGSERQDIFKDLHPFKFRVEEQDKVKFAKWVLENYYELSSKQNPYRSLLDFDQLKNSFEKKLNRSEDKLQTIKQELRLIRTEIRQPVHSSGQSLHSRLSALSHSLNKFDAEYSNFQDYKEERLSPNYSEVYSDIHSILRAQNGFTVGKYWEYLEKVQKQFDGDANSTEVILSQRIEELQRQIDSGKKRTLQKAAQMLLLHHLGLFSHFVNMDIQVKQKAKLIGALLNIGSENIEKNLGKLGRGCSDYEKQKNYQELIDYLYDIGLNKLAKEINSKRKIN